MMILRLTLVQELLEVEIEEISEEVFEATEEDSEEIEVDSEEVISIETDKIEVIFLEETLTEMIEEILIEETLIEMIEITLEEVLEAEIEADLEEAIEIEEDSEEEVEAVFEMMIVQGILEEEMTVQIENLKNDQKTVMTGEYLKDLKNLNLMMTWAGEVLSKIQLNKNQHKHLATQVGAK